MKLDVVQAYNSPLDVLRFLLERRHLSGALSVQDQSEMQKAECKLCRIQRVVRQTPQDAQTATTNFLASLLDSPGQVVSWVRSKGAGIEHYYGTFEKTSEITVGELDRLRRTLQSTLPGTDVSVLGSSASNRLLSNIDGGCLVMVEGIPSIRANEAGALRRALEGLVSLPFELIVIATPVGQAEVDEMETQLSNLYGELRLLAQRQFSSTESTSFTDSFGKQYSKSISKSQSTTDSTGKSQNTTSGTQKDSDDNRLGTALGSLLGAAVGLAVDVGAGGLTGGMGTSIGANLGSNLGRALSGGGSASQSESSGMSQSNSETKGTSSTTSESVSRNQSIGISQGTQWTLELVDRQALAMIEMLDAHFLRMSRARAYGFWRVQTCIVAKDRAEARMVANVMTAAIRGDNTHLEPIRSVLIDNSSSAIETLARGTVPNLEVRPHPFIPRGEQLGTLLTSDELALWFSPSTEDLPGIPARPPIRFGSNAPVVGGKSVRLGAISLWNQAHPSIQVNLSNQALNSHALVVGTTGSGKTTTVRTVLTELTTQEDPVPFMVLEPAKSEYEGLYTSLCQRSSAAPYRVGINGGDALLRFNPFVPPVGLPLGWYVDALKVLLRSSFSMQESLPQLLERLVLDAYADFGWTDFTEIVNDQHPYPDFKSLMHRSVTLPAFPRPENGFAVKRTMSVDGVRKAVHSLGYDPRAQATLSAALKVRLESFTHGMKGLVFSGERLPLQDWLNRPVFISLSDIKDSDVRRFIAGAIFLQLYGFREVEARKLGSANDLRHLLVLEEAHHFLENAKGNGPGAELTQESNRLIANSLAELRSFGQGIMIVDQSPTLLDPSVIRNTNTKIIHRMFYEADCEEAGQSIGLDNEQIRMLRSLESGEAVVHSLGFYEPVAVRITASR